jgi:hypothetical protein
LGRRERRCRGVRRAKPLGVILERETGIEPATNSLEGCDSTTELLPPTRSAHLRRARATAALFKSFPLFDSFCWLASRGSPRSGERRLVARGGFEPPKAWADRFTVCCV